MQDSTPRELWSLLNGEMNANVTRLSPPGKKRPHQISTNFMWSMHETVLN